MLRATLFALVLAFALALPAFAGLEEGEAAYERGDYRTAHREFLKAAEQGNAGAQYWLGWMYYKGKGVPKNDAEAARWYREAAKRGDSYAQSNLGVMHYYGQGVPKDYAKAMHWYRKAAKQGDARAQFWLGWMHENGEGVSKNYRKAARWYRKAAEQDDSRAQTTLGWMYRNGKGVSQSNRKAARWYREAAKRGDAYAQSNLGVMHYYGQGVPKDYAKAMHWYRKAAKQGEAYAQNNLGRMYYIGQGVPQDHIEAYKWWNLAAAQGHEEAAGNRDRIQRRMTQSQIAQAQARTREWRPNSDSDAPSDGIERHSVVPRETAPRSGNAPLGSTGSGFFVSSVGHILTNDHVIDGCARLRVSPPGGNATIKARDLRNDLALLQIGAGGVSRPAMFRSRRARLGETVVVAGYPLRGLVGDGLNVTRGEVSALSGLGGDSRHLQITAPVQPGNSGGPLLDGSGRVLGVVVSKLNAIRTAQITGDIPQNVNFAIRVESARTFLDAHNIPYQAARTTTARPTEQIAAEARAYTVLIECWE